MTTKIQRNATPTKLFASFASSLAVAATLAVGGTFVATSDAEALTCVPLFDGFMVCLDGNDLGGGDNNPSAPTDQYVQTINVTTHIGSFEKLVQSFRPNSVRAGLTRVCLINHKGGHRSLHHNVSNINPLRTQPGASSCANFPSNARVTFVPYTNSDRATPAKTLVYSLSRYDGGMLNLSWK